MLRCNIAMANTDAISARHSATGHAPRLMPGRRQLSFAAADAEREDVIAATPRAEVF